MKNYKSLVTFSLILALVAFPLVAISARAQDPQATALSRGYRTGYSDGYSAGLSDAANRAPRDFRGKLDYQHADRGYNASYGSLDDFRDGYQQGFEVGYNGGFEHRPFESSAPAGLTRKGTQPDTATVNNSTDPNANAQSNPVNTSNNSSNNSSTPSSGPLSIPRDTVMRVELMTNLSTDASQRGDRFQARVMEPKEYEGATIDGRVTEVKRPGKAKGSAHLQLAFEHIQMPDGRSSNMSGQVIEVIPMSSSRNVGKVDPEGGVQGESSTGSDVKKVGAAAGIGAVIGLIVGGGTGAAIGAAIGGGVGTAGVLTQRGKDIHLYQGQQLRIRTAGDATVQ
jgi:hypothetical protein